MCVVICEPKKNFCLGLHLAQTIKIDLMFLADVLIVSVQGEAVPELGLPVDIVVEEIVPETAFDPAFKKYVSLIDLLLGQGLALPIKGSVGVPPTPKLTVFSVLHSDYNFVPLYAFMLLEEYYILKAKPMYGCVCMSTQE